MARGRHVFLSCGEASGERYGAALLDALRRRDPEIRCTALGGDGLRVAGAEVVQSNAELGVMGIGEVISALPAVWRARRRVWRHLAGGGVDLVVPIDFPAFNGGLARRARKLGLPVFYLIPPQLWAWGSWRLSGFRRAVNRVGSILPFEPRWFGDRGVDVFAMGHPLMEDYGRWRLGEVLDGREARIAAGEAPLTLGLLPGSRRQEVAALAPVFKLAAAMAAGSLSPRSIRVVVSRAPGLPSGMLEGVFGGDFEISDEPLPMLLPRIDLALVCSGTASLETALAGVPHELAYRTGRLTMAVARRLVRTPYIGLTNLILETNAVPEHLQEQVTPAALARGLLRWARDPLARHGFYAGVRRLHERCGAPGVWERTAEEILALLPARPAGGGS